MNQLWPKATALLLLLIIVYGCSKHSPLVPGDESTVLPNPNNALLPDPANSLTPGNISGRSGAHLWAVWDINLDLTSETINLLPSRGALFTCNIKQFMEGPPMDMSAKLVDYEINGNYFDCTVDVDITNPFAEDKHTGFDIIGVFMGEGSESIPTDGGLSVGGDEDQQLLNPDGYTRWFNYPEFSGDGGGDSIWEMFGYDAWSGGELSFIPTAKVNPYKYFADGLDETDNAFDFLVDNPGTRGSWAAESMIGRRFELRFPFGKGLKFKLAIIAHWEPNYNAPGNPSSVDDFPPDANSDEALLVNIIDKSTAWYEDATNNGGKVRLDISPYDWSASVISSSMEEYLIRCYSDAWSGAYDVEMTAIHSGTNYHTFRTAIPVTNITSQNPIPVWIKVEYPGHDYSNDFGVTNDASGALANYFRFEVPVYDHRVAWIEVLDPNGGETLEVGHDYEIKWESAELIGNIYIIFSTDDFVMDIHPIAVNEADDGGFLWEDIPNIVSNTVKVRVSSMMNSTVYGVSDNYFSIIDTSEPSIRVDLPDGGEIYKAGTARPIRWVTNNVQGNLYIEYSKDDFVSDIHIIAIDVLNEGEYEWQDIPYDLSETVKIRISSMLNPTIWDVSDDYFIIDDPPIEVLSPDGFEEWKAGSAHDILWETIDFTGTLFIDYSKDYFVSDINPIAADVEDTGIYEWLNIPNDPSDTVRVRISSTDNPSSRDISDDNFSIEETGWGISFGGVSNENAYDVAIDNYGNVYTVGVFRNTVDFDPDPGSTDYHTSNGGMDVFLARFNELSGFVWARTWGGSGYDRGYSMALDSDGNILVTGVFKNSVDFDPGPGGTEKDIHDSIGSYDVFVSKFDTSGNFIWAKTFGGIAEEKGFGVDTDQFGNVYLTGSFTGEADLDPGDDEDNHTSLGWSDIYLTTLDSNGDYTWGRSWGGNVYDATYDHGYAVAVGDFGDIYVTGNVAGEEVDMDPDIEHEVKVTPVGGCDVFISKFDLTGNFEWTGIWGEFENDSGFGLATDGDGNVYIVGRFEGMVDFDPSAGAEVYIGSVGGFDAFVSKFNLIGQHQWARTWGGTGYDEYAWGVCTGGMGKVYVIGNFRGTVDFDPTDGVEEITSNGEYDFFLSSFNTSGDYHWARTWGGPTVMDYGYGVVSDGNGNAFISGSITGQPVDFDPGEEEDLRTTYNADAYVIKVMPDGEW